LAIARQALTRMAICAERIPRRLCSDMRAVVKTARI
jgi:hypothetical protein